MKLGILFVYEELSEDCKDHIEAILIVEELNIEELTDVGYQDITVKGRSFKWFEDEEEAEAEAKDHLLSDEKTLTTAKAEAGDITGGTEGWIDAQISSKGWWNIIKSYDSLKRQAQLKSGTWFTYIRTN